MTLEIGGMVLNTDEEGYLLDPDAWDECVDEAVAKAQGLELTEIHWGLINYFRTFYEDHMRHPSMHELVKTLGKHHGKSFEEAKKYRDFLYQLSSRRGPCRLCASWRACQSPSGR